MFLPMFFENIVKAYFNLAISYRKLGNVDSALHCYRQAELISIKYVPLKLSDIYRNIGTAYTKLIYILV